MAETDGEELRVVIADPDPESRTRIARIVAEAAGNAGHAIDLLEAEDGTSAYNLLETGGTNLLIAEVLLDGFSGYELVRRMKRKLGDSMPLVFLVTHFNSEVDRYWGLRSGAAAYIMKPFEDDVLSYRVTQFFEHGAAYKEQPGFNKAGY